MYWKVLTTRYAQFSGRAGRREFWLFMLVHFILILITSILDRLLLGDYTGDTGGPINGIYSLATIVPALALGARRLHDIGRTGWLQALVAFWPLAGVFGFWVGALESGGSSDEALVVPGILALISVIVAVIGSIILIIFAIKKGDDEDNAYGPPGEAPV